MFLRTLRDLVVLEGEPAAGAGSSGGSAPAVTSQPPAAPAAAATPGIDAPLLPDEYGIDDTPAGQPDPSQPATSAKADAAAPGEDGTARTDAPAEPGQLDEETVKAVVAGHLDIALQTPQVQEAVQKFVQMQVDQQLAQERALPRSDAQWIEYERGAADSWENLATALERYAEGETLPDARTLGGHVANIRHYTQQAQLRADFHSLQSTADAFEQQVLSEPDGLDAELVSEYRQARKAAAEAYVRFANGTPENREKAFQAYLDRVLPGIANLALADGKRIGAKEAREQYERDLKVKENNAGIAAYARVQAGLPPPTAGGAAPEQSELTAESIAAMSDEEYDRRRPEILAHAARELQGARR